MKPPPSAPDPAVVPAAERPPAVPVGLVLAAGGGRRLGLGPKALLPYRGRPLLEHAVAVLRAGGCERVLVVLGAGAGRVRARARLGGCGVVLNADWESGMGSSLRAGLAALAAAEVPATPGEAGPAALVSLVDTPGVTPEAVARMVRAHRAGARLAAAVYGGQRAHPVLIGAEYWTQAAHGAVGDVGARALLTARAAELVRVECGDVAESDDIDTPEAWARWSAGSSPG